MKREDWQELNRIAAIAYLLHGNLLMGAVPYDRIAEGVKDIADRASALAARTKTEATE